MQAQETLTGLAKARFDAQLVGTNRAARRSASDLSGIAHQRIAVMRTLWYPERPRGSQANPREALLQH